MRAGRACGVECGGGSARYRAILKLTRGVSGTNSSTLERVPPNREAQIDLVEVDGAGYSQVDTLCFRYKFVNFGAGETPAPPNREAQIDLVEVDGAGGARVPLDRVGEEQRQHTLSLSHTHSHFTLSHTHSHTHSHTLTHSKLERTNRPCRGGRCGRGSSGRGAAPGAGSLQTCRSPAIQGYLAHKKTPPPRTLQWAYAEDPMVVLHQPLSCLMKLMKLSTAQAWGTF